MTLGTDLATGTRPALPARPAVKPALRQVWRDAATLQLGVEPRRALVLAGLEPGDTRLLDLLDGSREMSALLADATAAGVDPDRCAHLLNLLHAADALDDATVRDSRREPDLLSLSLLHSGPGAADRVLARRRTSSVVVHGAGRVGATIAGLLEAAGIGTVTVVDNGPVRPSDASPGGIRRPRPGSRALATATAFGAHPRKDDIRYEHFDVAVVAPVTAIASPEVLAAVRHRPHLLAVVRETRAAVGPFVIPSVTPCARCVELGRRDRDPGWPAVTAQLVGSARDVEACDVTLATLAATVASMQVLAHLDGGRRPDSYGGFLEFDLADGRLRRRSVSSHPACGCGAAGQPATMEL